MLVSVGYMDPGNWSTDLSAGAGFRYGLLWIVALASLMAIFLQVVSARLGVVTGKDLAQCCRDHLPGWTRWPNYLSCELAIAACDLAEVLGSAVAIHLLFPRISLLLAVIITAFDVVLLLSLQRFGMRLIEALIVVLISTIGVCYFIEIFVLPQTTPNLLEMAKATVAPDLAGFFRSKDMVYIAIGIIGATVMPHNLYLHSALVQSRQLQADEASVRRAIRYNTLDSVIALTIAFFVNAAILVLAAVVFFGKDKFTLPGGQVVAFNADADWIQVAYLTLTPLLGAAGGEPALCPGAAGQRAEQHHHGNPGRAGGDGGIHALEDPALGAPVDHPGGGDHSGDHPDRHARRRRGERSAEPEPVRAGDPIAAGDVSAALVYQFEADDGPASERLVSPGHGMDLRRAHHGAGHLRTARTRCMTRRPCSCIIRRRHVRKNLDSAGCDGSGSRRSSIMCRRWRAALTVRW